MFRFITQLYYQSIIFYITHSFKHRGIKASLKIWLGEFYLCAINFDWYVLSRPLLDRGSAEPTTNDNPFQATYFFIARDIVKLLQTDFNAKSLYDVGAGNGRIIKLALELDYDTVYGVEIDEKWRTTLQSIQQDSADRFHFIIGDALQQKQGRKFDSIFLFNPMGREKFALFLSELKSDGMLPNTFALVNPQHEDLIQSAGYEVAHTRRTGKYVEYRIFNRLKR